MSHAGPRGDRRKKDRDGTPKSDARNDKPQAKGKPRLGDSLPAEEPTTKHMHNRTLYALMNFVGRIVQVQVKNGAIYEGIFHTANTDKGMGIILKMAKKKDAAITTPPIHTLVIQPKDFVQLIAKDVTFDMDETLDSLEDEGVFQTDTDISGGAGEIRGRELTPWAPDEGGLESGLSNTFEVDRGWDQFEVNEKLFGVKTSYQEELYTTALDRGAKGYAQRAAEASRLAAEIEGRTADGNIHLAEERGQMHTGSEEMDEEDRYSSVIRSDKYVPPAKRSKDGKKDKDSNEDKDGKKKKEQEPPRLERERSSSSLNSSTEDLGNFLPISPGKDKNSIKERIRLRLHIVNEKYKNTAPVTAPSDPQPVEVPRSPLLSPLVGNPKAINALSLEPCSPNIPEDVVRDFLEFSLTERAQKEKKSRQLVTESLKSFSRDLTNRASRPGSPLTMSPGPSPLNSAHSSQVDLMAHFSQNSSGIPNPTATTTPAAEVSTPAPAATTPAATPAATTPPTTSTTTAPAAPVATATAPAAAPKPMSKLNPNAKVFTPMSANAPVFTPKSFAPPPQLIPPPADPSGVYFQPVGVNMGPDPSRGSLDLNESVNDVYSEALKKKQAQSPDSAKTTVPYWMGPRGSYRNIAEEEVFFYAPQHPMGGPAPPRHPMGGVVPVAVAPMGGPVPGMNPIAMNINMNMPPGAVAGFPPQYVIPAGVAPMPMGGQPQPGPPGSQPMYHQPGVRPFQPMQPTMGGVGGPMQPSYVYAPPGMPPHTPPGPHPHSQYQPPYPQQLPHSPQTPPQMGVPQKRYYPHMSPQQQPPILMPHSPHSPGAPPSHPSQVYPSPPPNTSPSRPMVTTSPGGPTTPPNRG